MDLFYAHAHLKDVFNGGTMDNIEQTLSIGASQIAASQNVDGPEISPQLHDVKSMKELGKEPAIDSSCVNGGFKDSSGTVEDASGSETKKVTKLCNGESKDWTEERNPQSKDDDENIAEIDEAAIIETDANTDEIDANIDASDIFGSPNESSEKQVEEEEEEEDLAEISDDDIICDDDKNETKGERRVADGRKKLVYGNKENLNGNKDMVQHIKMDKENSGDSTETNSGLKHENDLLKEAEDIPDMSIDTEVPKSGCDNIKDQEQIGNTEKSETSKLNNTGLDESWTTVETFNDSIEMTSEVDTSLQHVNASSQSMTSDSEGPQLLLELSNESGECETKLAPEKPEVIASSKSIDNQELEEKSEKEDTEFDAFMEEISCSIQETSTIKPKKAFDDNNDPDTVKVGSEIDVKDVEDKSISKQLPDKGDTDKNLEAEIVIKSDESNAMEVDNSSVLKSDSTEQSVEEKENNCDVSVESMFKHSHITKTVAETAEISTTEVKSVEIKEPLTGSKDGVNENDLFKNDNEVDSIVKDIAAAKSVSMATDKTVVSIGIQKSKKLDQLLSKIASKAELVKANDSTVPKKAKARKSCASSSNSIRSSSSSSPSTVSSALPVSTSLTNLTFNVKELEKRGVLDMPKLQKRKAFDPIKIKHVEHRLQPTDDIVGPSSAKNSKREPIISPVKSPTKNENPFFNKNKIIKCRRRKGKRSGKYRLPGEKVNKRTQNVRKKESEERQFSDSDGRTTMSVTDKVRKSQQLEYKRREPWEVVSVTGEKPEELSARNAFNKSLGLSRKSKTNGIDSGSGVKQNALDIMTKNSKLSFTAVPSSNMKKAKKSVRHSIDSTTHRTLDSFLKGATYNQMNSSLKLTPAEEKKLDESQNSGSGDARKRKASESPVQTNSSTESLIPTQEEKKRKVDGLTSPVQTKMITLVPAGSPPMTMPVSGASHPILISPGSSTGTQTLIQNGTINGLPMFQLVSSPANSTSQPPQLLAIAQNQGSTHSLPGNTTFLQPKGGMPLLLTPVPMTSLVTSVAGSLNSSSATQTTTVNSFGNQMVSVGSVFPPLSQSKTLLQHLISPKLKSQLPNGQFLDVKQSSKHGTGLNGLYPVTPPRTPDEQLSETNSHDSVEVSPGGVVPPDKDVIPLCTCKISGASFQKMASAVTFCQSLDSVDGKVMGCCNKVTNMQLVRPAVKIPFLAVCEAHRKRLRVHQCCPGCGHYCTQGKFLQCKKEGGNSAHLFHEQCQVTKDGKNFCPHCGETSAQFEVHLTIQEHKPSIVKDNKPSRTQKTARILMNEKKTGEGEDSDEEKSEEKSKKLPTSSEITIGPDRYSLERFLNSLDAERPKKYRHLPKCLYTPAYDNDLERVVYMLEDGHDANEQYDDLEGQGALHAAAIVGSLPIVHILVQSRASPHMQDKVLKTPLMYASENNHPEVVSYLLRAGAVVNAKADDGMTSLHYSSKMGHTSIIKMLLETEQVKIDITDDGGWTPLIWATEHKELESVKLLLKRNADPNLRDSEENTTLHWAAFAGSVAIVELLLTAGCDLDSLNMHGDRPLHIAARQDHYECVVLFLARGADVEAKNNKGETPLECCLDQDSAVYLALKVNKQLKKFGAKHMGRPEKLLHRDLSKGRENIPIPCVNQVDDDGIPQDYLYVTDNIETTNLHINRVIGSLQSCQCKDDCSSIYCACGKNSVRCWYDKFGRLLSEFNMLEPPLIFECNRACECWTTCNNRVVQNGVMSRLQVFKTEGRGWGCRTLVDIPRGTFICEYIGEHISDSEADRREDDSYLFDLDNRDGETYCIDARRYGNIARFINHLCEPNLVPVKVFVDSQDLRFPRICLFASRDIIAQEELGFDYGEKFWIIKWKQFTCTCGSQKCRYSTETIQKTLEEYRQRHEDEVEINPE